MYNAIKVVDKLGGQSGQTMDPHMFKMLRCITIKVSFFDIFGLTDLVRLNYESRFSIAVQIAF